MIEAFSACQTMGHWPKAAHHSTGAMPSHFLIQKGACDSDGDINPHGGVTWRALPGTQAHWSVTTHPGYGGPSMLVPMLPQYGHDGPRRCIVARSTCPSLELIKTLFDVDFVFCLVLQYR